MDLLKRKDMVQLVVERGIMPPWRADTTGLRFKHTRALSSSEKVRLLEWLSEPKESLVLSKPVRTDLFGSAKTITLAMPTPLDVPPSGTDTAIPFAIPFSFDKERNAISLAFRSSDWRNIHHVNIFVSDSALMTNSGDELASSVFMHGWAPGNTEFTFTDGVGFRLPKAGAIRGDVHFSATPGRLRPRISFEVGLSPMPVRRIIGPVVFLDAQPVVADGDSVHIPPGAIKKIKAHYPVHADHTLVSLSPHMHIFGRSFKAHLVDEKDTTLLINIPDWDPAWQDFYLLERPLHLRKGSKILIEAEFDNTLNNPRQPFDPPVPIGNGWRITDEMFVMFMFGTPYMEGDESQRFIE